MAWISDDGTAFLEDRHALSEGEPIRDEKQDWNLISATETHASTIIKMSRLKNTGDPNDSCLSVSNRKAFMSNKSTEVSLEFGDFYILISQV